MQEFCNKKDAGLLSDDKKACVFLYDIRGNFMGLCVFSVDYDVRDQNS